MEINQHEWQFHTPFSDRDCHVHYTCHGHNYDVFVPCTNTCMYQKLKGSCLLWTSCPSMPEGRSMLSSSSEAGPMWVLELSGLAESMALRQLSLPPLWPFPHGSFKIKMQTTNSFAWFACFSYYSRMLCTALMPDIAIVLYVHICKAWPHWPGIRCSIDQERKFPHSYNIGDRRMCAKMSMHTSKQTRKVSLHNELTLVGMTSKIVHNLTGTFTVLLRSPWTIQKTNQPHLCLSHTILNVLQMYFSYN